MAHMREHGELTLAYATEQWGRDVYHNQSRYMGMILANLCRQGVIVRTKPGHYVLPAGYSIETPLFKVDSPTRP